MIGSIGRSMKRILRLLAGQPTGSGSTDFRVPATVTSLRLAAACGLEGTPACRYLRCSADGSVPFSRRDGGIGRRTRLKIERRKAWGFESPSRYVAEPQRLRPVGLPSRMAAMCRNCAVTVPFHRFIDTIFAASCGAAWSFASFSTPSDSAAWSAMA